MPYRQSSLYALVIALPFFVCLPFALSRAADQATAQPVPVSVSTARWQQLPALIEVMGTVQAAQRAAIAAKVTGEIVRVPVVAGSSFKAGDLLVEISAGEIAARLNQAEAQLAQAKRNLEREQNLLAKNAATPDSVKSMTEQYHMAQAGYREAKTMLGYTTVTAPFAGVVTRKFVNAGDLAAPGVVLLQIENNRLLQVNAAIPESLITDVHVGDVLTVKVEVAGVETGGTVTEVAPAADVHSRTAPVVLDLPPDSNLRTGQFARILLPGKTAQTLLVPSGAIVPSGQMDRIFVVEDGHARLRLVRIGMQHGGQTEILSGLNPGETVVVTNNRLLTDGQILRIQP